MALTEQLAPQDHEYATSGALVSARQTLREMLAHESADIAYQIAVVDYVNAFNGHHFGPEAGQQYFVTYDEVARAIHAEVSEVAPVSGSCITDIQRALSEYTSDMTAQRLRTLGYNSLPRACTLTLLDMLAEQRPYERHGNGC